MEQEKLLFIVFAVIAIASALNILLQRNPLYSALSLIGTLLALAAASAAEQAACCLDARMRQVYYGAYRREAGGWTTVHEPVVCAPGSVPLLPEGAWTGCGNGFVVYGGLPDQ